MVLLKIFKISYSENVYDGNYSNGYIVRDCSILDVSFLAKYIGDSYTNDVSVWRWNCVSLVVDVLFFACLFRRTRNAGYVWPYHLYIRFVSFSFFALDFSLCDEGQTADANDNFEAYPSACGDCCAYFFDIFCNRGRPSDSRFRFSRDGDRI